MVTDDVATAQSLNADSQLTGYVCPNGDRDFYQITIPQGDDLLTVRLQQTAQISSVAPVYQILDASGAPLFTLSTPSKDITGSHCLSAGTYYLVVQDQGNDRFGP